MDIVQKCYDPPPQPSYEHFGVFLNLQKYRYSSNLKGHMFDSQTNNVHIKADFFLHRALPLVLTQEYYDP